MNTRSKKKSNKQIILSICVFAMLGTIMFVSKKLMEALPNIHLLGMLVMVYTIVFRTKALIPIYVYVIMEGVISGFAFWWIPYMYIWTILWVITMLLPRKMPETTAMIVYPVVCSLFGFAYGTLYAPGQAFLYGYTYEQTLVWIARGLSYDIIHGVGNIFAGLLVLPLSIALKKACKDII